MLKKQLLVGILGIIIGLGVGYLIFNSDSQNSKNSDMSNSSQMDSSSGNTMHAEIEVDPSKPVPTVTIEAVADTKDGFNLHFVTQNYTLTPENVGEAPVANTGHMHLYVNGTKIARPYGPWMHLSSSYLKDGDNTIEVTLNANDHSDWLVNGEHISATIMVKK